MLCCTVASLILACKPGIQSLIELRCTLILYKSNHTQMLPSLPQSIWTFSDCPGLSDPVKVHSISDKLLSHVDLDRSKSHLHFRLMWYCLTAQSLCGSCRPLWQQSLLPSIQSWQH